MLRNILPNGLPLSLSTILVFFIIVCSIAVIPVEALAMQLSGLEVDYRYVDMPDIGFTEPHVSFNVGSPMDIYPDVWFRCDSFNTEAAAQTRYSEKV